MSADKEKLAEAVDLIGLAEALISPEREGVSPQQLNAGLRVMLKNVRELLMSIDAAESASAEVAPAVEVKIERKEFAAREENRVPVQKAELEILELEEDICAEDTDLLNIKATSATEVKTVQAAVEVLNDTAPQKESPLFARKAVQVSSTKLGGRLF
jgi:hypothetical protein